MRSSDPSRQPKLPLQPQQPRYRANTQMSILNKRNRTVGGHLPPRQQCADRAGWMNRRTSLGLPQIDSPHAMGVNPAGKPLHPSFTEVHSGSFSSVLAGSQVIHPATLGPGSGSPRTALLLAVSESGPTDRPLKSPVVAGDTSAGGTAGATAAVIPTHMNKSRQMNSRLKRGMESSPSRVLETNQCRSPVQSLFANERARAI